jgi:carbon-monoxide dehydrogenase large subunit
MNKFGIGQSVTRVEDKRFLTGSGSYIEDINLPRQAHGALVLSPHAHARITGIDTSAARAAPGVLDVLTGADMIAEKIGGLMPMFMPEDMGGPKGMRTPRMLLATDKVRHVGDRVAFVVAETPEQARDAAELVEVSYEVLPSVIAVEDAVKDGAPRVWEEWTSNVGFQLMFGDKAATEQAFAGAKHVVSLRLENNRLAANPMENRGAIGEYHAADDSYTLYTSTQNPHGTRGHLAGHVFHKPETQFRVVARDVGGGFGMKGDTYPEEGLVLWAARRCGRPVKWISSRSEAMLLDNHGRDQVVTGKMALDENGKILAIQAHSLNNVGCCVSGAAVVPVLSSLQMIPGVYAVPAVFLTAGGVFTNTGAVAPYRGAGRPEAVYFTERLLDEAARALDLDPAEIRRRNFVVPQAMPHHTPTHATYDGGDFATTMEKCLALADWSGFAARREASERRGKLRGRGLIYYIEICGIFNDRMELRFDPSGGVSIVSGLFSHGQGHATTFPQVVSDWLGVPFESIRLIQGDTAQVAYGRGTYASRSITIAGGALREAADTIIEKGRKLAAHLMEAAPADVQFGDGKFVIAGTDKSLPLTEVAKASFMPMGLPQGMGIGLEGTGTSAPPQNFPNGCHICEVEVDPETGVVAIDRFAVVDDVGTVINPMICEGQISGGLAQGIGQALMEHVVYDKTSGQLLSGSLNDYAMPRADDFPDFAMGFNNVPCTTNILGVKGAGEAGSVGAPPAVINAILDALRPLGVASIDMPATPQRVWSAIQAARPAAA